MSDGPSRSWLFYIDDMTSAVGSEFLAHTPIV
jgi:hypothetical protein